PAQPRSATAIRGRIVEELTGAWTLGGRRGSFLSLPPTTKGRKELISRNFLKPSDGLEPSTPSLPCAPGGNRRQSTATVPACLSRFRAPAICDRLPPVAPARLHRRSILCNLCRQQTSSDGQANL